MPHRMADARRRYGRNIFGVARIIGPGQIDFDTLIEMVLAAIPEQPEPSPRVGSLPLRQ